MATTVHRKDMSATDFKLLARFSALIQHYDHYGIKMNFGTIYSLGMFRMLLPVWISKYDGWKLDRYKDFRQEAIGIELYTLRNMCRYLDVKECVMVNTLFRFSMLAVAPQKKINDKPKFRIPFVGSVLGFERIVEPDECIGFVIEKRRAMGGFKDKAA